MDDKVRRGPYHIFTQPWVIAEKGTTGQRVPSLFINGDLIVLFSDQDQAEQFVVRIGNPEMQAYQVFAPLHLLGILDHARAQGVARVAFDFEPQPAGECRIEQLIESLDHFAKNGGTWQ